MLLIFSYWAIRNKGAAFRNFLLNYSYWASVNKFAAFRIELRNSNLNQLDAQNIFLIIRLLNASTCFEHYVLIIRRSNCIIQHLVSSHSVGGCPVYRCAPDGHLQSVTIPDAFDHPTMST